MCSVKLANYNDQWLTSHEHSFVFQNLSFGKYRLEVQSSINGEDWSESVFSPYITISNPFWLTFPGLLIIFLFAAGGTILIIYYTRKITKQNEEELRKIEQLKYRAVQAKFIPHFTGNVLNSINYLISKNPNVAQKYISDFADFSHLTLLNSDTLFRTLEEELTYTQLYLRLEKLRFEEALEYEIQLAPEFDAQIMIPTMVLQTFCENAIKHGLRPKPEGGKIVISAYNQERRREKGEGRKEEANSIVLAVEDNGIGREAAKALSTEGTQEGLKIVQQQLEVFNKYQNKDTHLKIVDLTDSNGQAAGTRFEVWID